jgi:hypothetical protein
MVPLHIPDSIIASYTVQLNDFPYGLGQFDDYEEAETLLVKDI